ncbi:MAG: pyridoxal phosphate-dependent aminotransferase [Chelatococcus sp.]|uniref:pyridoxal phosphate-dependent aminotransferase n=1 Tax=Chelatococcus sp. TaxID=1953771 RepID=UPI0025BE7DE7|nr:pyridoxal phosphate-dependent aminotransferase [Chelatococcus sp.]MBX3540739.1 pyridoxal phosphate-dependent aminotransferase [Chelatococcus sp.]
MNATALSPRMSRVRPSPTAEISDKVRALTEAGRTITNLGEGELDFDTPDHVKKAAISAIKKGDTKYTAVAGTAALKEAIIAKFAAENDLAYQPSEVIAGAGAKQLIFNALLATVAAGDEVIIPAPYWVSYPDMVALAEGKARILPCRAEDGWKLRPADLAAAITPQTRWLILNSPGNPTGVVYSPEDMRGLTDVLMSHPHVLVMADDIYEHLRFGVPFATPAAIEPRLKARTLTVNGVSKSYSMTGWRIGYAGGPAWLIAAMQTLQSQSTSNACSISQAAAVAALKGGRTFMDQWQERLVERRAIVMEMIRNTDVLTCASPDGAFYAFANCAAALGLATPAGKMIASDLDFATYLLEEAGVAVVHGAAFGASPYIRIAYALDNAVLKDACHRVEDACRRLTRPAARKAVA